MESILSEKYWAVESRYFAKMHPLVMHRLSNGRDLSPLISKIEEPSKAATSKISNGIVMMYDDESENYIYQLEDGRKIARIPMVGALNKYGGLCSYGAIQLEEKIKRADASKTIDSIILVMDGPGGSVAGTTSLGMAVSETQKPVIAFVDGMAASAHYWVASQADYIVMNEREYSEVGSIGVLSVLMNIHEMAVKQGVEIKIMRADQSVDKAQLNDMEPWPQASLDQLQAELNQIAEDFISTVKQGRGARLAAGAEDVFTGRMYGIAEAIELGLADHAGTLADAIRLGAEVAKTRKELSTIKNQKI